MYLTTVLAGHLLKTKKEYKNLMKQEFQDKLIKMNQIKPALNMIQLMEILTIYPKEQLLIKYYMINHLISLKIENKMDINMDLLQWFISFLIKSLQVLLKAKLFPTSVLWTQLRDNKPKNYTSQFEKTEK